MKSATRFFNSSSLVKPEGWISFIYSFTYCSTILSRSIPIRVLRASSNDICCIWDSLMFSNSRIIALRVGGDIHTGYFPPVSIIIASRISDCFISFILPLPYLNIAWWISSKVIEDICVGISAISAALSISARPWAYSLSSSSGTVSERLCMRFVFLTSSRSPKVNNPCIASSGTTKLTAAGSAIRLGSVS